VAGSLAHRAALWKSLALPASGTVLFWLLMTTLGLPLMNYTRSYVPLTQQVKTVLGPVACVHEHGLTRAQISAFQYHGKIALQSVGAESPCEGLLVNAQAQGTLAQQASIIQWRWQAAVRRPTDAAEVILVYRRLP